MSFSFNHKSSETFLVIIILAVVSAITVPHLSSAKEDTRESELMGNLQMIRSQLELYRAEHNNQYPQYNRENPRKLVSIELFVTRLAETTFENHSLGGGCGPYMEDLPENPYNGLSSIRYGSDAGKNTAGWVFDTKSLWLSADDSEEHAKW